MHGAIERELVLQMALALHDIVGSEILRANWRAVVWALECLGDLHAAVSTGLAEMSYRRALDLAMAGGLPSANRLRAKLRQERRRREVTMRS